MTATAGLDVGTADRALDALVDRVDRTLGAVDDRFPLYADPETGTWETTGDGNWCGGHWIGLLWLARARADSESDRTRYGRAARERTAIVRGAIPETTMFCGMARHYAGFRAYDATGDRDLFALGLSGADAMVDLFDGAARQVPSGTFAIDGGDSFAGADDASRRFHTAAVDNVYTALPVCWRAYRETGDPRFRDVAVAHTDRHLDWFVREDGGTVHHVRFDPETGAPTDRDNELGAGPGTCWARGLGWSIAGLSRAYRETGATRYLRAIERSVDYYRERSPAGLVPYWDLEAPGIPDEPRDTSAAALVGYGLSRLPENPLPGRSGRAADRVADLRGTGRSIVASLVEDYLVTGNGPRRGMVLHGCYDGPGAVATDHELVWTDYYVAYALASFLDEPTATD